MHKSRPLRARSTESACRFPSKVDTSGVKLVLVADTHVPKRARVLPAQVWAAIESADLVVHAGDWVDVGLLEEMELRAQRLVGVVGNNDGAELRARLPETARVELDGLRVTVVHETGGRINRERRMDVLYAADTDLLVFGHSHIPWDTQTAGGIRLLNPGSPTDRRRQPVATYMTAQITDGTLSDVTLVPVRP
jgi:putative phosphoesterase